MADPNSSWNDAFLTVAEVADHLKVSRMSIYRLIHAGELEAVSVGHTLRVGRKAVDGYLRQSRVAVMERHHPARRRVGGPIQVPVTEGEGRGPESV